jgi:hypothetical protein
MLCGEAATEEAVTKAKAKRENALNILLVNDGRKEGLEISR